jgi:hypothetical protein
MKLDDRLGKYWKRNNSFVTLTDEVQIGSGFAQMRLKGFPVDYKRFCFYYLE